MQIKFDPAVEFEGKKIDKLEVNLEAMTGKDISRVKSEWALAGKFSPAPAMDMDFCAMLGCQAAGMPLEFAEALPAKLYMRLTSEVSNFLLS